MNEQPKLSVMQIAEALAGKRSATEIVNAIAAHRPPIDLVELAKLLDRAKELQIHAEKLQRKASILMDVVEEIVKASPERPQSSTISPHSLTGGRTVNVIGVLRLLDSPSACSIAKPSRAIMIRVLYRLPPAMCT